MMNLQDDDLFVFSTNAIQGFQSVSFPVGGPMDETRFMTVLMGAQKRE